MIELNPENVSHDVFIFAAFRYALGRRTAGSDMVADVLIENAGKLTASERRQIVREVNSEMAREAESVGTVRWDSWLAVCDAMEKT